ncbi:MAG TPA: ATP-binding protein [Acidimicrobiia bacterium]|nr:ATP-binding protein [Acidimicrobiia bacterium]
MSGVETSRAASTPPIDLTLARVVLLMRLLGWVWMVALALTVLNADRPPEEPAVVYGAIALATVGAALMLVAVRMGFLGSLWYVAVDGVISITVLGAAWLAGAGDFVAGGVPMSWLFLMAYATRLELTALAGLGFTAFFAWLHVLMDLRPVRVVGSVQFLIVGLIVSWAFDALRTGERLRRAAQSEAREAQEALVEERELATRLEERSRIARRLHDSVLQTLKLIMSNSGDADEVRYLARVQERELRRTINQYRSPFADGLRARLLDARADVEDRYRVEVEQVIKGDMEMTPRLESLVSAVQAALTNAARHSGISSIDLFVEVRDDGIQVHVRDRGRGFEASESLGSGIQHSIVEPVRRIEGTVSVKSAVGSGTDISIFLPR